MGARVPAALLFVVLLAGASFAQTSTAWLQTLFAKQCPLTQLYGVCTAAGTEGAFPAFDCTSIAEFTDTPVQGGEPIRTCSDNNDCTMDTYDPEDGTCTCKPVGEGPFGACQGTNYKDYTEATATHVGCTDMRCHQGQCITVKLVGRTPGCSIGGRLCQRMECRMVGQDAKCTGPFAVPNEYSGPEETGCCGNAVAETGESKENCCIDFCRKDSRGECLRWSDVHDVAQTGCPAEGQSCITRANTCVDESELVSVYDFGSQVGKWAPAIAVALLIGYFIAAIGFMVANFVRMPELEAWAKAEVREVSLSAFYVANAIFFITFIDVVFRGVYGVSFMAQGGLFLSTLAMDLVAIFGEVFKANFVFGFMSFIGVSLGMTIPLEPVTYAAKFGFGYYPLIGTSIITNAVMMASNMLSFSMFSAIGLKVLLETVSEYALTILLPAGIVLRCFTLTRKLGATLMAFSIGLYVAFPISLAMDWEIYNTVPEPSPKYEPSAWFLDVATMATGPMAEAFGGPNFTMLCNDWWDWAWCWQASIVYWAVNLVIAIATLVGLVVSMAAVAISYGPANINSAAFFYYANLIPWMVRPMVAAFLFPLLDLIVVVTFIRAISPAIGGETRITGLVEFI